MAQYQEISGKSCLKPASPVRPRREVSVLQKPTGIAEIRPRSSYTKQELDSLYKSWSESESENQSEIASDNSCKKGFRADRVCTDSFPCLVPDKEVLCYDLVGEFYTYPAIKSGELTITAKEMAKAWRQFVELPKKEAAVRRGGIQFDERMDRLDLQRRLIRQRPPTK